MKTLAAFLLLFVSFAFAQPQDAATSTPATSKAATKAAAKKKKADAKASEKMEEQNDKKKNSMDKMEDKSEKKATKAPLSPPGSAEVTLGGKTIHIDYSRPSIRGRKIMGGLVPYGQVWRTGANSATSLKTDADLNIGGTAVPAGSYTLYTWPTESGWKLIINKQTGQWGTEYNQAQDLARVDLKKSATAAPVEMFTIAFDKKSESAATLRMEWENTRLTVDVTKK